MGDNSAIIWTDSSWNPIVGCSVHTPGCTNCYAMKMAHRLAAISVAHERDQGGDPGPFEHYRGITVDTKGGAVWNGKVNEAPHAIWTKPMSWKRPRRIFVNSMSDLFHPDVSDETIDRVFAAIASAPQHTYQILTKREQRMHNYMTDPRRPFRICEWLGEDVPLIWPLPQVWLGVSVEDQERANLRVPYLLASPARIRWISLEPLLGPVNPWTNDILARAAIMIGTHGDEVPGIDWVVLGGESGPKARPMHPDWVNAVERMARYSETAFLFKQWGEWMPVMKIMSQGSINRGIKNAVIGSKFYEGDAIYNFNDGQPMVRVGKRKAGRMLGGVEYNGYPA